MNAPPFPLNPAVGEWFQNWVWNGSRWVCSRSQGVRVLTTVFTATAPYQPSPGLISLVAHCIGGGAGGGGAGSNTAAVVESGGGGGSGGYSIKTLPAALVLGGVMVTIGEGGGAAAANEAASPGGATSFGAFCIANGGQGGFGADPGLGPGTAGAGAAAGVGDVAFPGAVGDNGGWWALATGAQMSIETPKGGVVFGGNVAYWAATGASIGGAQLDAGGNTGAGGAGAVVNQVVGGVAGGAGGSGICWVDEYCWADAASDGEDCVDPGRVLNVNARVAVEHGDWGPRPPRPPKGPPAGFLDDPEAYEGDA